MKTRSLPSTSIPVLICISLLVPILLLASGCQSVGILEAENLQRPALAFQARGARAQEGGIVGQIETGRFADGGVAAGGCASCK